MGPQVNNQMKKPKITVVGSNMVDLISYIDRMPQTGETITAPDFNLGFGGKGANQAVAAALLGADVAMVTKIGDDLFGPPTKTNLESYGINTSFTEVVPEISSGVAPIFVDQDSNNSILIIKGANNHLRPEDIDRATARILQSDIVILQLEIGLETIYHTIKICKKNRVPVILNPAPADTELQLDQIRDVDFFIPNETELQTLTGMEVASVDQAQAAARSLLTMGFRNIIVTLGRKGSVYISEKVERLVSSIKVQSLDTTGAGDAFIGCFAACYCETGNIIESMEISNRYAAISTLNAGTQKSFVSRTEFEAME
jgi:ribokinase